MPVEIGRTTARKIIHLPGGQDVSIPVITKINFIDASDRYQETEHTIDNSSDSLRIVHVDRVHPTSGDTSQFINVERIDIWKVLDPFDRYQETEFEIDNVTGADNTPPHFSTHLRTHVIKYYADPDNPNESGAWVASELIDEIALIDPHARYQESQYTLINTDLQADPADPDISDTLLDPPYRTDPFQNIVDWHVDDGSSEPFFRAMAWPEFDGHLSGQWFLDNQSIIIAAINRGDAFIAGEIDIRFVDQFFEPHTYDTTAGPPATGEVKGYTWHEWDVGWSPSPFPPGASPTWFEQLEAYKLANPTPDIFPDRFDFPSYGYQTYLKAIFDAFIAATGGSGGVPRPVVWVRFAVIGAPTTGNPAGRY